MADETPSLGGAVLGAGTVLAGVATILNHSGVHAAVDNYFAEQAVANVAQAFVWGVEIGAAIGIVFLFAVSMTAIGAAAQEL